MAALLILSIVVSAILSVLGLIFTAISFAYSKSGRFIWLSVFIISLIGLFVSVYFTARAAGNAADRFTDRLQRSLITGIDTTGYGSYNIADSAHSQQIKYLKLIEPEEYEGNVPPQFYNYLGFIDYYRMPLVYPFSLHCNETPELASLFNEKDVTKFDENDNGEEDCRIDNITEFVFDNNLLIAKQSYNSNDRYIIYEFKTGKKQEFKNLNETEIRAKQAGFKRPLKFMDCKTYYELLSK